MPKPRKIVAALGSRDAPTRFVAGFMGGARCALCDYPTPNDADDLHHFSTCAWLQARKWWVRHGTDA